MLHRVLLVLAIALFVNLVKAQCPQIIDGNGQASGNPQWIHCAGTAYTLFIQTNQATGPYVIDWGDGTTSSGASLIPPATVSHNYPATLRNYTVTFTETNVCTVTGLLILERPVNASITRPMGSGGATTICAPGSLDFINTSTDGSANTTYRWNFGDGSPIVVRGPADTGQTISHTYQRNTVNCNTVVTLTAENFCTTTPSFAQVGPINVYDLDDAAITPTAAFLCYPDTVVGFLNTSNQNCRPQGNTVQRYEYWNFGNYWGGGDSTLGWIPFANPPSLTYTLKFPGKGTYNITMYDSNMCGIDTTTTTIVIGDPPVAAFAPDKDTVCAGERIRFFNNSTGGGNQSRWNFGDGVWRTRGMGNQNRTFNTPGTYTIYLAVNNTNGTGSCTDTIADTIHVLPGPTADFSISPASGCDSFLVSVTENASNAALYSWDFGDGTSSTLINPPPKLYDSVGVYTLELTVTHSNGCTDDISRTVTVYGSPVADFTPKNVCEDVLATFTDNSTHEPGDPIISWIWDFGDGGSSTAQNPQHKYDSSKTYILQLTVATANCTSTDTFSLVVEPKPTAEFTISDTAGCSPLLVSFTNNSLVSSVYYWDFGDGDTSTLTAPTHSFVNSTGSNVFYGISLVASTAFGCSDTAYDTVEVYQVPNSAFTSTAVPACGPYEVSFTNTSTGGVNHLWIFGDGDTSTQNNPSHTYQNQTNFITIYQAQLVVYSANGCTDTSSQSITIYPEPIFPFQTIPDSGCSPLNVTFPALVGAVGYKWYFGDGDSATGPSPSHVFTNATTNNATYITTLIATNSFGCSDTNTSTVLVFPNPSSSFTALDSVSCQPHSVTLTNSSTGGVKFYWDFGDGDTSDTSASSFPHIYSHNQAVTRHSDIRLITETADGCRDTAYRRISTYPKVIAGFSRSAREGCSPLQVIFQDTSTGAQFYDWQFGDGSTSSATAPSHTFTNSSLLDTSYVTQLKVTSQFGCVDSTTDTTLVHPLPRATFTKNTTAGCHPLPVIFTNTSLIADTNFWDFGDGNSLATNSSTVPYTYQNTGSISLFMTVKLVTETRFGCKDSTSQVVQVYPEISVNAGFTDTSGCTDLNVVFTDSSTGAQFYFWDFGDGNSSNTPNTQHTFSNKLLRDTTFVMKYVVTSGFGCKDSLSQNILVHPKPISNFNSSVSRGCQPLLVSFTNNSQIADFNYWDFGDGDTSMSSGNPVHSFTHNSPTATKFRVWHVAETANGCKDSTSTEIEVFPKISADFDQSDTAGCSELTLQFFNQSVGENQYDWDFGDGNSARIADPVHRFSNPDTNDLVRTVKLKVTSIFGCSDSINKQVTIYPQPVANFLATPGTQKFPSATVSLNNTSSAGPWSHAWQYGDGGNSSDEEPGSHIYSTWGDFEIQLIVSSPNCADTASQFITIEPPRAEVAFTGSGGGCRPLTVEFENNTIYGKTFLWNFGDGETSNAQNPAPHIYRNPGTFTITLTVIGHDGDVVTEIKKDSVTVNEESLSFFDYRPEEVSVPNEVVLLYNLSNFSDRWIWDMGDGTTYTERNPEHYYQEAGVYTITLIADNEFGCADTFTIDNAVTARAVGKIEFPTAFIPNSGGRGDGRYDPTTLDNDVFFPIYEGVIEIELMIFNRWGEMVFRTEDIGEGWTGYYRDTERICAQDVYVWKARGKYVNGRNFEEAGEVTLLR